MTGAVHQLKPLAGEADVRKQEFLALVGDLFQRYVAGQETVPDAICVQIGGMRQPIAVGISLDGETLEGGGEAFLCRAHATLLSRIVEPA